MNIQYCERRWWTANSSSIADRNTAAWVWPKHSTDNTVSGRVTRVRAHRVVWLHLAMKGLHTDTLITTCHHRRVNCHDGCCSLWGYERMVGGQNDEAFMFYGWIRSYRRWTVSSFQTNHSSILLALVLHTPSSHSDPCVSSKVQNHSWRMSGLLNNRNVSHWDICPQTMTFVKSISDRAMCHDLQIFKS